MPAAAAAASPNSGAGVPRRRRAAALLIRRFLPVPLVLALAYSLSLSLTLVAHEGIRAPPRGGADNNFLLDFFHERGGGDDADGRTDAVRAVPTARAETAAAAAEAGAAATSQADDSTGPGPELVDDDRPCFRARPPPPGAPLPIVVNASRPVLNLGFPKQGSTTLHSFFECGGLDSSHYQCRKLKPDVGPGWHQVQCGKCIRFARRKGHTDLLEHCGGYEAYTQLDVELDLDKGGCYFPQIIALSLLHDERPDATFVLTFRPVNKWISSMEHWKGFDTPMVDRLGQCGVRGLDDATPRGFADWWCDHVERVRKFVRDNPSHRLVEVDVEAAGTGRMMAETFGIDEGCWAHSNRNVLRGLADDEVRNITAHGELPKWMRKDIRRRKREAEDGSEQPIEQR